MLGLLLNQTGYKRAVTTAVYKRSEESLIAFFYICPPSIACDDERDSSLRLPTPSPRGVRDQFA